MILRKRIFYYVLSSFFLFNCERYVSYNLESESTQQAARIYGKVTNTFTGSPVNLAQVSIESYSTLSDGHGEYTIIYILRDDEIRNKPVRVSASALNYLPFSEESVLYPTGAEFNISMDYAAPILRKTALVYYQPIQAYVCQALVVDYQGISTMDLVFFKLDCVNSQTNKHKYLEKTMPFISSITDSTGYYQCFFNFYQGENWEFNLRGRHELIATDQSGYMDKTYIYYNLISVGDTLLFPPTSGG